MTQPSTHRSIDPRHLVVIGADPGLGAAIARGFGREGFHLTLLSRGAASLETVAADVRRTGVQVDQIVADPAHPEALRESLTGVYERQDAPGVLVYNASILAPDNLLTAEATHLHEAYDVDVVGAIVATQVAAPVMHADGGGTIPFTGGGFADHPVKDLGSHPTRGRLVPGGAGPGRCRTRGGEPGRAGFGTDARRTAASKGQLTSARP